MKKEKPRQTSCLSRVQKTRFHLKLSLLSRITAGGRRRLFRAQLRSGLPHGRRKKLTAGGFSLFPDSSWVLFPSLLFILHYSIGFPACQGVFKISPQKRADKEKTESGGSEKSPEIHREKHGSGEAECAPRNGKTASLFGETVFRNIWFCEKINTYRPYRRLREPRRVCLPSSR